MGDLDDANVSAAIRDTEVFLETLLLGNLEVAKARGWRAEEQLSRYLQLEESVRALDAQVPAFRTGCGTQRLWSHRLTCLCALQRLVLLTRWAWLLQIESWCRHVLL